MILAPDPDFNSESNPDPAPALVQGLIIWPFLKKVNLNPDQNFSSRSSFFLITGFKLHMKSNVMTLNNAKI